MSKKRRYYCLVLLFLLFLSETNLSRDMFEPKKCFHQMYLTFICINFQKSLQMFFVCFLFDCCVNNILKCLLSKFNLCVALPLPFLFNVFFLFCTLRNAWPGLAKFRHIAKILKVFGQFLDFSFIILQNVAPSLAFLCYWANRHCCKGPNIK